MGAVSRCVLVGGADIGRYETVRAHLRPEDFYVFCDCGLRHMEPLGVTPDLIVGDFDSHPDPHLPVETITLPREKDDTDTVYGAREGLRRGFSDFLLLGVVGGRIDHTLGNLALLLMLDSQGKTALALSDDAQIQIVSRLPVQIGPEFPYFSLLALSGDAHGVWIQGAKYPLSGEDISCDYPIGVSNQPLPGQTARVWVEQGRLLLVKGLPVCGS